MIKTKACVACFTPLSYPRKAGVAFAEPRRADERSGQADAAFGSAAGGRARSLVARNERSSARLWAVGLKPGQTPPTVVIERQQQRSRSGLLRFQDVVFGTRLFQIAVFLLVRPPALPLVAVVAQFAIGDLGQSIHHRQISIVHGDDAAEPGILDKEVIVRQDYRTAWRAVRHRAVAGENRGGVGRSQIDRLCR